MFNNCAMFAKFVSQFYGRVVLQRKYICESLFQYYYGIWLQIGGLWVRSSGLTSKQPLSRTQKMIASQDLKACLR